MQDRASDANGVNGQGASDSVPEVGTNPGSQRYADVLSVLWQSTWSTRKVRGRSVRTVSGFRVVATLATGPVPPAGTAVAYAMTSNPGCAGGGRLDVVYVTDTGGNAAIPRSALRDTCSGSVRWTPLPLPVIGDETITWTVPLSVIPANTGVRAGTTLRDLGFVTSVFRPLPSCADVPPGTRQCSTDVPSFDRGRGETPFRIGS